MNAAGYPVPGGAACRRCQSSICTRHGVLERREEVIDGPTLVSRDQDLGRHARIKIDVIAICQTSRLGLNTGESYFLARVRIDKLVGRNVDLWDQFSAP